MGTTTKQTKGMGKVIPLRRRERDEVSDLETAIRNEVEKVKRAPESFADFEAAVHARFMAAEREVFAKVKNDLQARSKDPEARALLQTFDLLAWLDGKARGQSFATVVREKFLEEVGDVSI